MDHLSQGGLGRSAPASSIQVKSVRGRHDSLRKRPLRLVINLNEPRGVGALHKKEPAGCTAERAVTGYRYRCRADIGRGQPPRVWTPCVGLRARRGHDAGAGRKSCQAGPEPHRAAAIGSVASAHLALIANSKTVSTSTSPPNVLRGKPAKGKTAGARPPPLARSSGSLTLSGTG
jgi:hypothetical protein